MVNAKQCFLKINLFKEASWSEKTSRLLLRNQLKHRTTPFDLSASNQMLPRQCVAGSCTRAAAVLLNHRLHNWHSCSLHFWLCLGLKMHLQTRRGRWSTVMTAICCQTSLCSHLNLWQKVTVGEVRSLQNKGRFPDKSPGHLTIFLTE